MLVTDKVRSVPGKLSCINLCTYCIIGFTLPACKKLVLSTYELGSYVFLKNNIYLDQIIIR